MGTPSSLDSIKFVIPPLAGKIRGKERPRLAYTGSKADGTDNVVIYTPKNTAKWESHIRACLLSQYAKYTDGRRLTFWLGCQPCDKYLSDSCPAGCKRKRYGISLSMWMYVKGTRIIDVSNAIKAIEDSLNGIAYHDDNQIVALHHCVKIYNAESERIVVRLSEVDDIVDEEGNRIPVARTTVYRANEAIELVHGSSNSKWLRMMLNVDKRKTVRKAIEMQLIRMGGDSDAKDVA